MGCIILLLTLLSPRLVLFLVWLLNNRQWDLVFQGAVLLPLLGFIFLPFTTLIYLFAYNPMSNSISPFGWIWLIIALFVDLAAYGSNAYRHQTSRQRSGKDVIDV